MTISLPPDLERFIAERVRSGLFPSESAVVHEGLRLLKNREKYQEWLRKELAIGIGQADRGESAPLDMKAIMAEVESRLAQKKEAG